MYSTCSDDIFVLNVVSLSIDALMSSLKSKAPVSPYSANNQSMKHPIPDARVVYPFDVRMCSQLM